MKKEELIKRIRVASGVVPADLVIKNGKIVDVFTHSIRQGDIAISDGYIAGVGSYEGWSEFDAEGNYIIPGLIESHIHVESSMLCPEEFGRLMVPCGTTTAIADPHEIVNVCGSEGLDYMIRASENTAMDIKYMIPSCVPCTPWENSGATIDAQEIERLFKEMNCAGLGEFMNVMGVLTTDSEVMNKLMVALDMDKIIDGHAPGINGKDLAAYASVGIRSDHECSTVEEMEQRLANGMYVMLRDGSAGQELSRLAPAVTEQNARRVLLASDDRLAATILERGDLDDSLRQCVRLGIDPITAVQIATLNAAEYFRLEDRGAIAPGRRADLVMVDNLRDFTPIRVWIEGWLVAENGEYIVPIHHYNSDTVNHSMNVAYFSEARLKMELTTGRVHVMRLQEGSLITKLEVECVQVGEDGDFVYNPSRDIAKMAVVERHNGVGTVGTCLVENFGIKKGAIALTVAHDSHNIIVIGTNNRDMAFAVNRLIDMNGGIVMVCDGEEVDSMPLPIGGLMSDKSGEEVAEILTRLQTRGVEEFGVNPRLESIMMSLSFLALPVIPEVKLTDRGLFNVTTLEFIGTNADAEELKTTH